MWHMLGRWKISQTLSSLALTVWEVCCFEYISTNQDLPLLIMKVFVEQPPATPGQLNMLVPDIYLSQLVVILFFIQIDENWTSEILEWASVAKNGKLRQLPTQPLVHTFKVRCWNLYFFSYLEFSTFRWFSWTFFHG